MSGTPLGPGLRQRAAADPAGSVWVSANAGSGKTKVLIDRVARLLLGGVAPERILCLTYTKAAAAEMQVRLFARLGGWAMLPPQRLRAELADLVGDEVDEGALPRARRLFAQAIETPGGLRIQTIHSFCAGLLRRFPLEAGVSPAFAEIEDRAAKLMIDRILDDLAEGIAPGAMAALAARFTGADLRKLAEEVTGRRRAFARPLDLPGLRHRLGLATGETEDTLAARTLRGDEAGIMTQAAAVLASGSQNDRKVAEKIAAADLSGGIETVRALEGIVLYGDGRGKGAGIATKATQAKFGPLAPLLDDLALRIAAARPMRLALEAAARAVALHGFAAAFLPEYAARKAALGALDFDDLIERAHALLSDPALGPWVRFRLDGSIDHILVDEAQDTCPLQWQIIAALAEEFTAGEGAAGARGRSLFVVGDRKQSIYSFQGADLTAFAEHEAEFAAAFEGAGAALRRIGLEHSFRSSAAVLRAVDATFDAAAGRALDGPVLHLAHHAAMPGRVDLWPAIEPADKAPKADWHDPVDLRHEAHHAAVLADRIAAFLAETLAAGTAIPDRGKPPRPLTPGDVLILVRKRSTVFAEVIRALKAAGLPVAGADRLRVGAELAVKDIQAVLSVLALPADDLSLAAALRSPLFGLTEDALYRLARGRTGTLWQVLRENGPAEARAVLADLMAQADFLRPFDLIERLLTRHDGRRRLIGRLGAEAEDGIDALLAQALAYERQAVPSLTGFLDWLAADEVDLKRRPDAGPVIRVMTVHGAKGLEAPLVILPDTARHKAPRRNDLIVLGDGTPVWRSGAKEAPPRVTEALAAERERETAEDRRLLYVAMTRAQSWLVVAAAGDLGKDDAKPKEDEDEDASPALPWYRQVRDGLMAAGAIPTNDGGLRLTAGDWPAPMVAPAAPAPTSDLPAWADAPAPPAARLPGPVAPSGLGGAKALPGETAAAADEEAAKERGSRLHRLLEHLPVWPRGDWPAMARALLPGAPDADELADEAARVLTAPDLGRLFAPGTLAEVPFAVDWAGRRLAGTIDRLEIGADRVRAIDFKSNRLVPASPEEVPEGLLRQMGAYDHALRRIFPGRAVEVALVWTARPLLMPLPPALVAAALDRAGDLDLAGPDA